MAKNLRIMGGWDRAELMGDAKSTEYPSAPAVLRPFLLVSPVLEFCLQGHGLQTLQPASLTPMQL